MGDQVTDDQVSQDPEVQNQNAGTEEQAQGEEGKLGQDPESHPEGTIEKKAGEEEAEDEGTPALKEGEQAEADGVPAAAATEREKTKEEEAAGDEQQQEEEKQQQREEKVEQKDQKQEQGEENKESVSTAASEDEAKEDKMHGEEDHKQAEEKVDQQVKEAQAERKSSVRMRQFSDKSLLSSGPNGLSSRSKRRRKSNTAEQLLFLGGDRPNLTEKTVSGDFSVAEEGYVSNLPSFISLEHEGQEEEGEQAAAPIVEEEVEEEEVPPIDREPYIELYNNLMRDSPMLKMKNNFLQRKMAEYFKRRKMEHVLRESDRIGDAESKYNKKLDTLWELRNINNLQRDTITNELNEMRALHEGQLKSVNKNFNQMLARERDVGCGLIFTKTAKEIPEKFVERLLKNQALKSKEIEDMRLTYIRIRDSVTEVQNAIKTMDKIGENYTLIDYEQLKMENQNHADKIEERDDELSRLRTKYSAAIQCLAHFREKSTNTEIDIMEMNDRFDEIEVERNDWRERVNHVKQERDVLRLEISKRQEESGLLIKPKLLFDMEDTLARIRAGEKELQAMRASYVRNAAVLKSLKKNMQTEKEMYHPQMLKARIRDKKPKVRKGRVKLVYPVVEKFCITEFEESCLKK